MEVLRSGDVSVAIDPVNGARLASVRIGDQELLLGPDEPVGGAMGWGCFPMIPWAGRIRHGRFFADGTEVRLPLGMPPHAIHGTTYMRSWDVDGPGRFATDLGDQWPWRGRATHDVEIGRGGLTMTIGVHAAETMPVTAGWHPWFRRSLAGVDVEIENPAERMWRRDDEGIPDGTLVEPTPGPWDDCFTALTGPVVLRWPGVLELAVASDCEHVTVYDEVDRAVCVEPQSAPPDAHNLGEDLAFVPAGTSWTITTTWTWRVP